MKRPWILLVVLGIFAAGCHSPSTTYDPFLGRSTVPPPGTGAVAAGAPYYNGAGAAGGVAPAFVPGSAPSLAPMIGAPPLTAPPGAIPMPPPAYQPAPSGTF